MKLLLLIRSLEAGGAERQLAALAKGLRVRGHDVSVALFYARGAFLPALIEGGVPVHDLRKSGRWDVVGFLLRLLHLLRRERPQVVYSFLPGANILTVPLRPWVRGLRWVWGVRSSFIDLVRYDRLSRLTYRLEARWSRHADAIIVNSQAGRAVLERSGYPADRVHVVPNGIDLGEYAPEPERGRDLAERWGLSGEKRGVGIVGRLDVMKDHSTFLRAAALLCESRDDVRFVVVGDGPAPYREELQRLAEALGVAPNVVWAGQHTDMPAAYNALCLSTSASYGEGMSNALVEAMACGVPCVATDVGDSAEVVGDTGALVPPRDPDALARAWQGLLSLDPAAFGRRRDAARARIRERYAVDRMVEGTEAVLHSVLGGEVRP